MYRSGKCVICAWWWPLVKLSTKGAQQPYGQGQWPKPYILVALWFHLTCYISLPAKHGRSASTRRPANAGSCIIREELQVSQLEAEAGAEAKRLRAEGASAQANTLQAIAN